MDATGNSSAPTSAYEIKYITFVLLGLCMLWPWNAMLSLTSYMSHDVFKDTTIYAKIYTSTMMTVSTITSVFANYQLSKQQYGYSIRIKRGLIWQFFVFVVLAALVGLVKKFKLLLDFFIINLLVLISSVGTAYTQNGSMAWANVYGSEIYSQAIMMGQAIAGVLPSLVFFFLSFIEAGGDARDTSPVGIFFYYIATAAISIACYVLFNISKIGHEEKPVAQGNAVSLSPTANSAAYASHEGQENDTGASFRETSKSTSKSNTESEDFANKFIADQNEQDPFNDAEQLEGFTTAENVMSTLDEKASHIPLSVMYAKLKYLVLAIFLCFAATLLFPVFAANTYVSNFPLHNAQFIPLAFTVWNVGDLYGRYIASKYPYIFKNPRIVNPLNLFWYSIIRMTIIPFFFTCNIFGHMDSPFVLQDVWYLFLQFLFGVTNGNCISLSFMNIGDQLGDDDELKAASGGFSLIFVSSGLTFGSVLSYLFVYIINTVYK
ncbi:hypothetical protein ACO0QE_003215 [Hanseniaspora vineae]